MALPQLRPLCREPGNVTARAAVIAHTVLAAFPTEAQERLASCIDIVWLQQGRYLAEAGADASTIYLPLPPTLLSRHLFLRDGRSVALGLVGRGGIVGLWAAAGLSTIRCDAVVRAAGNAVRVPIDRFRKEVERSVEVQAVVLGQIQSAAADAMQAATCIAFHSARGRCATTLLRVDDALGGAQDIPLSHETLADLLGVRRATVTLLLGSLRRQGLIDTRRSHVQLGNRADVEREACECYRTLREVDASVVDLRP